MKMSKIQNKIEKLKNTLINLKSLWGRLGGSKEKKGYRNNKAFVFRKVRFKSQLYCFTISLNMRITELQPACP